MRITALCENSSPSETLEAEHGLSIYIETKKHTVLFDTGQSAAFIRNAEKLGIDLLAIDYVVISHGHYDHLGGLIAFLELNKQAKVILKKEIFAYQYHSKRGDDIRNIGYPEELLDYQKRFIYLEDAFTKTDNLYFIGDIEQQHPLPKGNSLLYRSEEAGLEADKFEHELLFVIEESDELAVFSGCAHRGILNMLESVKKHLPGKAIKLIYGGLHLTDDSEYATTETTEEILAIASEIRQMAGASKVYTGHCTGKKAMRILSESFGESMQALYTGQTIEV